MLKTPKDFVFDKLVDSLTRVDYRIAPNDALSYRIFTKNGFDLINLSASSGSILRSDLDITVESDGMAKMPLIGRVKVAGLTIKEAEVMFEEKYSENYVQPFVNIKVTNKRVIVFPGTGGAAKVLPLANNNTTIMEAIASAGGISEDGKAYKVKLIRKNIDPALPGSVYMMDLSVISGLASAQSKVQAGDIIYVEPRYKPFATFAKELTPIFTVLTSALLVFQFTLLLNQ
jgi:polysaccharide export outer membrane protein